MRKLFSLLMLLTLSTPALAVNTAARVERIDVLEGGKNVLLNSSFDERLFDLNWSLIGTATDAVEASTVIDGKKSAKIVISASGDGIQQSVTPTTNTLNQSMEASCRVNTNMTNIQLCATSGGVEQACQTVPGTGSYQSATANFIGPTNGTAIGVKVKSNSSGGGVVYVDDCYVGPARNISQGSSGQWVGSITISGCASPWNTTSTTFVDTTQTGCVYTAKGALSAPTSNWPGFQIASAGAGYYFVDYRGMVGPGNAGNTTSYYEFYDGTNEFSQQEINGGSVNNFQAGISGHLSYTTAQSNLNVRVRMKNDSGQSANIYGTSLNGVFNVYFFPSQSQTGYKPDQTPASWSGYQTGNWTMTTSGTGLTYGDFTTGNSPALAPIGTPRNITCVTSGTAAQPGITCNLPKGGANYLVSVNGSIADGTGANNMLLRLTDGTTPFGYSGYISESATANKMGFNFQGQYTAAAAGSVTFKLQAASDASSQALTLGTGTSLPSLVWNIQEQDAPLAAPYLTGSEVCSSGGVCRHEWANAYTACTAGTCTLTNQSGGYTSIVNSSHVYTATFNPAFSGPPSCTFTSGNGNAIPAFNTYPTASSVQFAFFVSGVATDTGFTIDCHGPR